MANQNLTFQPDVGPRATYLQTGDEGQQSKQSFHSQGSGKKKSKKKYRSQDSGSQSNLGHDSVMSFDSTAMAHYLDDQLVSELKRLDK